MIYDIIQYIHVLAAVTGLGVAFGFPILARTAKTRTEAMHALQLYHRFGYVPNIVSLILLATSIFMIVADANILYERWFVVSLVLYVVAQVYVWVKLPNQMNEQHSILETYTNEELPESYRLISKKAIVFESATQLIAVIIMLLMVFRP